KTDLSRQPVLEGIDFLFHRTRVGNDTARPVERSLAFRRKPQETRATLHEHHAEYLFELLDARRHGRLGHAARFGGAPEMPFTRERQKELQLVDHRRLPLLPAAPSSNFNSDIRSNEFLRIALAFVPGRGMLRKRRTGPIRK